MFVRFFELSKRLATVRISAFTLGVAEAGFRLLQHLCVCTGEQNCAERILSFCPDVDGDGGESAAAFGEVPSILSPRLAHGTAAARAGFRGFLIFSASPGIFFKFEN